MIFALKLRHQYASIAGNEFVITEKPNEPSIIIGLIPDSHRVYLNGHAIGGSNHLSDLALYTFDRSYLHIFPDKNIIVIKAEARANLNPGIMTLSDIGPQLGEFNKLNFLRSNYYLKFYILKNIYFVFSFIAFLLSLTYAVYLKNKNEIFYSSLFLLLGCLHYLYYNPWVFSTFDYQFLRFLRLSCIVVSSLVLYSGYLATRGRKTFCSWNNSLALIFGVVTFGFLNFYEFATTENFVSFYNTGLLLSLVYISLAALSAVGNEFMQRKELNRKSSRLEPYFFLFFTFLSITNILGAFKNGRSEVFFSSEVRTLFNDVGISISFLFAISRITLAVFEFTKQKRQNLISKRKDEFFVELTKVVSDGQAAFLKIDKIQKLANQFINSEKSSLYLTSVKNANQLKLHSYKGYTAEIEKTKSTLEGVFGYVIQNKRPLLIEDINLDYRFEMNNLNEIKQFKSGSCMIFPLIVEDKVYGVLTFADKVNKLKFASNDLELGLRVSSFVSLLIASSPAFEKVS